MLGKIMKDVTYFKGTDKNSQRTLYVVFEEPQKGFFNHFHGDENDTYTVIKYTLDKQAKTYYKSISEAIEEGEHLSREISKEEFEVYKDIQIILDELYLHDFTGGFPRTSKVDSFISSLRMDIRTLFKLWFTL